MRAIISSIHIWRRDCGSPTNIPTGSYLRVNIGDMNIIIMRRIHVQDRISTLIHSNIVINVHYSGLIFQRML